MIRAAHGNGYRESVSGTVRDDAYPVCLLYSVAEARARLEGFRQPYSAEQPHCNLGYQSPLALNRARELAQADLGDSPVPT